MPTRNFTSNEAQSLESTLAPKDKVPALVADESNKRCVDCQYQIYRNAKLLNDKGVMTRMLTVERWVRIGGLHIIPAVHDLFTRLSSSEWLGVWDLTVKRWCKISMPYS